MLCLSVVTNFKTHFKAHVDANIKETEAGPELKITNLYKIQL
jgi:hypothetical protein